jgi:hypothetical protein
LKSGKTFFEKPAARYFKPLRRISGKNKKLTSADRSTCFQKNAFKIVIIARDVLKFNKKYLP